MLSLASTTCWRAIRLSASGHSGSSKNGRQTGRLVAVQPTAGEPMQWSAPENLQQVQRGSLAILRREVVTCPPPQFADFVVRWQGVHPGNRRGESAGLTNVLSRLEALALPAALWEQSVLPARVPGYQARWLDEWTAGGSGIWACHGDDLAFIRRESLPQRAAPPSTEAAPLDEAAARVVDLLRSRGASFVADLAADTELSPSGVRSALWSLLRRGAVTNDRFDVVRRGEFGVRSSEFGVENVGPQAMRTRLTSRLLSPQRRSALRTPHSALPEGRWSVIAWGQPEPEAAAVFQAAQLLRRYGIVSRELALLDPWMPPWRVLYEVLSRMELAGDVRRGYFAEGLSGAQFALPEAAQMLQDIALPSTAAAPAILLHSQDPANLYGSGAPFDVALLDGGTRPLLRRSGNWLVLRRPAGVVDRTAGEAFDCAYPAPARKTSFRPSRCCPVFAAPPQQGTS